jgi:hypothetical protein
MKQISTVMATLLLSIVWSANQAHAVPSFARQTGMACSACHTMFPQLNAFGRQFKMNGYTMTTAQSISSKDSKQEEALKLLTIPGLSAMAQFSYSRTNNRQPTTQNDNAGFPQEFSLFYAGAIAPKMGIFSQLTYEQSEGKTAIDNIDLRYADTEDKFVYGITANNNPTVQDVWNTTPAWGYPFASSASAPSPTAAIQLEGALSQRVAGVGGYFLYNNWLYGEATLYRSADQGMSTPPGSDSTNTIQGVSPYWRLAVQNTWDSNYIMVGTYGLHTQNHPQGVSGDTDKFTDVGFDTQYENYMPSGTFVARARWTYERQSWDQTLASSGGSPNLNLNALRGDLFYYFMEHYGIDFGYFNTYGSSNDVIYSPASVSGSRPGKPNSDGFIAEFDYQPWMNTKLALQYTLYNSFNGSSNNYDGSSRNASANNTLYLLAWFAF